VNTDNRKPSVRLSRAALLALGAAGATCGGLTSTSGPRGEPDAATSDGGSNVLPEGAADALAGSELDGLSIGVADASIDGSTDALADVVSDVIIYDFDACPFGPTIYEGHAYCIAPPYGGMPIE